MLLMSYVSMATACIMDHLRNKRTYVVNTKLYYYPLLHVAYSVELCVANNAAIRSSTE